jgi:hypothetical protein
VLSSAAQAVTATARKCVICRALTR